MNLVLILSGVSGCGKSSYVKEKGATFVASADNFFMDLTGKYNFNPAKLSEAHGACFRSFIQAIQDGSPLVMVDNTNTTSEEISPYVLGATAYGYEAQIITFGRPVGMTTEDYIAACAKRNAHGVPEAGVKGQFDRINSRKLPPWWSNTVIHSKGLGGLE